MRVVPHGSPRDGHPVHGLLRRRTRLSATDALAEATTGRCVRVLNRPQIAMRAPTERSAEAGVREVATRVGCSSLHLTLRIGGCASR